MSRQLILTGWGRSDYAASAAAALKALGEADVLGVSMRRLADILANESAGRAAVYVLGIGLGNEAEAFAEIAGKAVADGTEIFYLSGMEMDLGVRKLLEKSSVTLGVYPREKGLVGAVEKFFGVRADDIRPYAAERKDGESSSVAKYQELLRAAGYIHRTNGDDGVYATAIRSLAAGTSRRNRLPTCRILNTKGPCASL